MLEGFNIMPPTGDPHPAATLQDGLYIAGMLNVFQRQCEVLKVACLAQGAGQLPLIVKPEEKPLSTPLYFPYQLYRKMESQLLSLAYWSPVFQAQAWAGISASVTRCPSSILPPRVHQTDTGWWWESRTGARCGRQR